MKNLNVIVSGKILEFFLIMCESMCWFSVYFISVYCFFAEANVLDDKGEVHLEKIATHIEKLDMEIQEIAMNMGKKCLNPQGDSQCDRAFWFHKCWKTADPRVKLNYFTLLWIFFGNFKWILYFSALFFGLSSPNLMNIISPMQLECAAAIFLGNPQIFWNKPCMLTKWVL